MTENRSSKAGPAVVAGVDGSAGSYEALRWALAEARLRKAPLRVLHTWIYLHARRPVVIVRAAEAAAKEHEWTFA